MFLIPYIMIFIRFYICFLPVNGILVAVLKFLGVKYLILPLVNRNAEGTFLLIFLGFFYFEDAVVVYQVSFRIEGLFQSPITQFFSLF